MLVLANLQLRLSDDLRIEADFGAPLTSAQCAALAEGLVDSAVRKQAAEKALAPVKPRPRRPAAPRKATA